MIHPIRTLLATVAACGLMFSASAFAAPKDYQYTGVVTETTDTTLSVKKGTETWEFAKDASTKADPALKVGDKVEVHYTMTAGVVDLKSTGKDAKADKKADKKGAKADKKADNAAAPAAMATTEKPAAEASPVAQ